LTTQYFSFVHVQDISGYTKSSDIYSVGIAALELATGEAPYAGLPVTQVSDHYNDSVTVISVT